MTSELLLSIAGTAVVAGIAVVSARAYDHRGARYSEGRERGASIDHFRYIYRWLQLTSIGIGITAFWSDAAWLLRIHDLAWLSWAGLAGALAAAWMFISAKRTLGENYSPCFDAYAPFSVVSEGLYRRIRHPIYTANIALLASFFLATGSLWLLANTIILTCYYAASAVREEAELAGRHEVYRTYQSRTGRFLPRLLPKFGGNPARD